MVNKQEINEKENIITAFLTNSADISYGIHEPVKITNDNCSVTKVK